MVRNKNQFSTINGNGKSPAKQKTTRKSGDSSDTSASTNELNHSFDAAQAQEQHYHQVPARASVHKQNFYIVSYPIIFLFNILRSLLYQLFIIFKYIFTASTRVIYRPVRRKDCTKLEVVNTLDGQSIIDGVVNQNSKSEEGLLLNDGEIVEMSLLPKHSGPGPGDPLLAKQKHHHRRAFEYISKALKIDEENEGEYLIVFFCI